MKNWLEDHEKFIGHLIFYYRQQRYEGQGFLKWSIQEGFCLNAFIREGCFDITQLQSSSVGKVIPKEEYVRVRMRLAIGNWAITPPISLDANNQIQLADGYLSICFSQLTMRKPWTHDIETAYWKGFAVYEVSKEFGLPNRVDVKTTVDDSMLERSIKTGICIEEPAHHIIRGFFPSEHRLRISWEIHRSRLTRKQSRVFPYAIKNAISFVYGQDIQLLNHHIFRAPYLVEEIRQPKPVDSISHLLRLSETTLLLGIPQEKAILELAFFFAGGTESVNVACMTFRQILAASQQPVWQVKEYMVVSVLEAILRSVYGHSLMTDTRKSSGGLVKYLLSKFVKDYFLDNCKLTGNAYDEFKDAWRARKNEVLEAFELLRDRSAHPDWISTAGGNLSTERIEDSILAMRTLCQFYGHAILGLAGFKNLRPQQIIL